VYPGTFLSRNLPQRTAKSPHLSPGDTKAARRNGLRIIAARRHPAPGGYGSGRLRRVRFGSSRGISKSSMRSSGIDSSSPATFRPSWAALRPI
jgi:hypothetical protein